MTEENQIMTVLAKHMDTNVRKEVAKFMELCEMMEIRSELSASTVQFMLLEMTVHWLALTSKISEEEIGEMCKEMLRIARARKGEGK